MKKYYNAADVKMAIEFSGQKANLDSSETIEDQIQAFENWIETKYLIPRFGITVQFLKQQYSQ